MKYVKRNIAEYVCFEQGRSFSEQELPTCTASRKCVTGHVCKTPSKAAPSRIISVRVLVYPSLDPFTIILFLLNYFIYYTSLCIHRLVNFNLISL